MLIEKEHSSAKSGGNSSLLSEFRHPILMTAFVSTDDVVHTPPRQCIRLHEPLYTYDVLICGWPDNTSEVYQSCMICKHSAPQSKLYDFQIGTACTPGKGNQACTSSWWARTNNDATIGRCNPDVVVSIAAGPSPAQKHHTNRSSQPYCSLFMQTCTRILWKSTSE